MHDDIVLDMTDLDHAIYVTWIAFWIFWLALGTRSKAAAHTQRGGFLVIRIVIAVVVVSVIRSRTFRLHGAIVHDPLAQGVGTALFLAGLLLAIWARVHLGRNWGKPMSEKVDAELVTSGPYRYIRNPIYSGLILAMVGSSVAISPYCLVLVAIVAAYFVYSSLVEERIMSRLFPATYPHYRRSTKRLIPFVF